MVPGLVLMALAGLYMVGYHLQRALRSGGAA